MPNQILPNVGLNKVAEEINDLITHAEVGTGTTTPAAGDIALDTATDRIATTTRIETANQFQNRVFFANGNLPATLKEVGFFMNGSGSLGTGQLLLHALVSFTKGNQDLQLIFEASVVEG